MRALDNSEATPIAGTEDAYCTPIFSPDGQSLAFYDVGTAELKRVALAGGFAKTLTKASGLLGATWGADETIIYADVHASGLRKISSGGGTPVQLTRVDAIKGETAHRWPTFLPDGKTFLFAIENGGNPDHAQVVVQRLDTGERKVLVQGGTYPQYVPAGYLVYVRGGKLTAALFDLRQLEVRGPAITVSEDVQESGSGASQLGVSSNGSLVYVAPNRAKRNLVWVGRNGTEQLLPAPARNYEAIRLSPDGQRAAIEIDNQIWLYELSRDILTRFTLEGDFNFDPVWSPDNKWIVFQSSRDGAWNLFWQRVDGSGGLERLTDSAYAPLPSSWSPNGQLLAFVQEHPKTRSDIWMLRLSDRKVWPVLQTSFNERLPAFSPDGNWLAYASDESGRYEVYVQSYPEAGAKYQISIEGGTEPAWNSNGSELFYRTGNKIMAVKVSAKPSFSAGKANVILEGQYPRNARAEEGATYAPSRDGQRFLMYKQSGEATQINVVLNWFEELKHLAAYGG